MKQSHRIGKNIAVGGIQMLTGGLAQIVALSVITHHSSRADFGVFSFILALAMFIWLLADAGLCNILVREIAAQPEKMLETLGAALSLIWVLSIGGMLIVLAVVPFLHFTLPVKCVAALMGAATLTQLHCAGYGAALRSREDNELQAFGHIAHKVLMIVFLYAGFKIAAAIPSQLPLALLGVVLSHLIPSLLFRTYLKRIVMRRYGRPKLEWNPERWKYLLSSSIPVGGAGMLRVLDQQMDVLVLTSLTNLETVGLFSGPYRISMALRFIPQGMSVSLYPMLSRLATNPDKTELQEAYQRSIKFFLLLALPVATLFLLSSERLIAIVLGAQYVAAAPAMQWLSFAFVPYFISFPMALLITALHQQRFLLASTAATFGLRVAFNFAFIPVFGILGPCIAFLVAESLTTAIWIHKLWRLGLPLHLTSVLFRSALACALMGVLLYLAKPYSLLIFIPAAIVSTVVYFIAILKLRILTPKDIELGREGVGFLKPFLAARTNKVAGSAS